MSAELVGRVVIQVVADLHSILRAGVELNESTLNHYESRKLAQVLSQEQASERLPKPRTERES